MKIYLDNKSWIDVKSNYNKELLLTIKAKKDERTNVMITTQLSKDDLDRLIDALIAEKVNIS